MLRAFHRLGCLFAGGNIYCLIAHAYFAANISIRAHHKTVFNAQPQIKRHQILFMFQPPRKNISAFCYLRTVNSHHLFIWKSNNAVSKYSSSFIITVDSHYFCVGNWGFWVFVYAKKEIRREIWRFNRKKISVMKKNYFQWITYL